MIKINSSLITLGILCSTLFFNQAFANCHGHFQNNSNESWTISFDNKSSEGERGNVYFRLESGQYCDESHLKNGPCSISPGEELEVDYTETNGNIDGTIFITDSHGTTKSWNYSDADLSSTDKCMEIHHSGSDDLGAIILNSPSDGGALFKDASW